MNKIYSELQWLPRAPETFNGQVRALRDLREGLGRELQALALYALDTNQLIKMARIIEKALAGGEDLRPLEPFRLAVLSNSTLDLIMPALVGSAARHGIALDVIVGGYDQVTQGALSADSKINRANADAVLLALDYRALGLMASPGDRKAAQANLEAATEYLRMLRAGIKKHSSKAVCIFQSFAAPPETLFGNLDRVLAGTIRSQVDGVNRRLVENILERDDVLVDVSGLAETVGTADWHDPQLWNIAKVPFAAEFIPIYAEHVARVIAAMRGKSRKVLILDLDNTLWGGVIGDDGLECIKIAQGDATGEAHLELQRYALNLRERGVLLAVCSKNMEEIARAPFQEHPEMLLKTEHIAAFHANWDDKATNIRMIAEELSLGHDAVVFVDDNPAERGLVRSLLPDVAVPEMPENPSCYARLLSAAGYFEGLTFSKEDEARGRYYEENARRSLLRKEIGSVDAYLETLRMTVTFQPFNTAGRPRITQLINKSNQYNLTTKRYGDAEVAAATDDSEVFTLQARLEDVFGDNGMISVVICRQTADRVWDIDTWLMSCRVLGRQVEFAVLQEILTHARAANIEKLTGVYRPTNRNALAADHYRKLGFAKVSEEAHGTTVWELPVETTVEQPVAMKVISRGFARIASNTAA
jgi:FkbH-like protein